MKTLIVTTKDDMTGKEIIQAERQRQIEKEGWTAKHDDSHNRGQLERAADCYFDFADYNDYANTKVPKHWPWSDNWWKPKNQLEDYIRAGALYQAEMDRHERKGSGSSYWTSMKLMRIECENRINTLITPSTSTTLLGGETEIVINGDNVSFDIFENNVKFIVIGNEDEPRIWYCSDSDLIRLRDFLNQLPL